MSTAAKMQNLATEAYLKRPNVKHVNIGVWKVQRSFRNDPVTLRDYKEPLHFLSFRLRNPSSSTEADWELMGQLAAEAGAPKEALVTDVEKWEPKDAIYWIWKKSGQGIGKAVKIVN